MSKERASANTPALSRRSLLTALPLSGAGLALSNVAQAEQPEDPILPLYRDWLTARLAWENLTDFEQDKTAKGQAHWDAIYTASGQMENLTPTSFEGMAALIHVLWFLEGPQESHGTQAFFDEIEQTYSKLMRRIFSAGMGGADLIEAEAVFIKGIS